MIEEDDAIMQCDNQLSPHEIMWKPAMVSLLKHLKDCPYCQPIRQQVHSSFQAVLIRTLTMSSLLAMRDATRGLKHVVDMLAELHDIQCSVPSDHADILISKFVSNQCTCILC
jgi:hypothetical protein